MIMHLVSTLAYGTRLWITWRGKAKAKVKSENRKAKIGNGKSKETIPQRRDDHCKCNGDIDGTHGGVRTGR
jgi:hypothetical protein